MTKVIKWYQQFSFWTKVQGITGALGIGSEIALYIGDSHWYWKAFVGGISIVGILAKYFIEDKNNNNIVDLFERVKYKKPK